MCVCAHARVCVQEKKSIPDIILPVKVWETLVYCRQMIGLHELSVNKQVEGERYRTSKYMPSSMCVDRLGDMAAVCP